MFLLLVLQQKQILGDSTRNRKFYRLEPHFQPSATRSAPKEDTKKAVALAHSRECTKDLISGLPSLARWKRSELYRQKNEMSSGKKRRQTTCFHGFVVGTFFVSVTFFLSSSSTAASPEVHRNRSISSSRGVHAILSVVFCTLHTPRCGLLLQTTKQYLPL